MGPVPAEARPIVEPVSSRREPPCEHWLRQAARFLAARGLEDAREEAEWTWRAATGMTKAQTRTGVSVPAEALERFQDWIRRRGAGEPLAYLEGKVGFYGLELQVDPRVLVPRADSETVVEAALANWSGRGTVVDAGTGSGCLLLALLAQRPAAGGLGIDLDAGALAVAAGNAAALGLAGRARFLRGSWLEAAAPGAAELIVSNPPYVVPGEALGKGVAEFEPALALFTPPEQPFWAYVAILARAGTVLASGGALVFEVGAGRARALAGLAREHGFRVAEVRRDLGGIDRAVVLLRA